LPDTITLGSDAWLQLEYAADTAPVDGLHMMDAAEFSQDWIDWNPSAFTGPAQDELLRLPVKIYQINPFRVEAGHQTTQVVLVDFRTSGLQETASIRDPRRWGWNLLTLIVGALLLTALLLLIWWIWTARKVASEKLPDWEVPPPAWLQTSIELKELQEEGLIDRGEGRQYLDRLAGICRRFVAGRFRVGAVEMTGPEIARTCAERGHRQAAVDQFTTLIAEIDSSRYDPESLSVRSCRQRGRAFMAGMADVRIVPRYTPVPAALSLAADSAWAQLTEQLLEKHIDQEMIPDEEAYAPGAPGEGK